MDKIYRDTIGFVFHVDCGQDITLATSTVLDVEKPDGTREVWVAIIDDTNYLNHTTVVGDLDQCGKYRIQTGMELSGWSGNGETFEVFIYDKFQ